MNKKKINKIITRNNTENLKERRILILSTAFLAISFLARLFFAGQSAAKNVELRDLFATRQDLEQQVSRLKYDDLRVSSIAYVEEKAKQQGFAPMSENLLSLDVTVSPPLASATLTR
jgi:cell division protein FtsB